MADTQHSEHGPTGSTSTSEMAPFSHRSSSTATSSSSPPLAIHNLKFPTFLFPSMPFRRRVRPQPTYRRNGSPDSGTSSTGAEVEDIEEAKYLTGHTSTLHCSRCAADLCHSSQIISKGFTGRHGRAYLVSSSPTVSVAPNHTLPNTLLHAPTPRHLVTGLHTVSDVSCIFCASVLGWKYVAAEEESQRYKVGKFILETKRVRGGVGWEEKWDDGTGIVDGVLAAEEMGAVEFDSDDEDECEDLFAGIWTAEEAEKRRKARVKMGLGRRPPLS